MASTADRLIDLLDNERRALLEGRLADALALSERKLRLTERIEHETLGAETARRVRDRARRNEALLAAAMSGIKSARERIASLFTARPLSTYGSDGRRQQIGGAGGTLERRA